MRESVMPPLSDPDRIPPAALALGLGGVLPFLAGALAVAWGWPSPALPPPSVALQAYGAVILSFLGGARWGLALHLADSRQRAATLAWSVLPSLAAWAALLQPPSTGLPVLAALFLVAGLADLNITALGAPPWYRRLRVLLTAVVVTLLCVAAWTMPGLP
jgi:hypothetical protein